jgi:DnaJ-class molecular chaperone
MFFALTPDCVLYRTLLNQEEIKKAYRELCMKHHPDVASQAKPDCEGSKALHEDKFKRISAAHATLIDDKLRSKYNYETINPTFEGIRTTGNNNQHGGEGRGFGARNGHRQSGPFRGAGGQQHHFLDGIFRPKNMFWGLTFGLFAAGMVKSYLNPRDEKKKIEERHGQKHLVEAWYNPNTKRYEQPVPWDPVYQSLSPIHEMVARHLVHPRDK